MPSPQPPKPTKPKVIVFGILFFYPLAGVTYQFLHYLLGLRRLGYDVYYIEDSARYVYDLKLEDFVPDPLPNIRAVAPILDQFGFEGRWAFRGAWAGGECHGMSEQQIRQLYRDAEAFLNVTGSQEIRDEHMAVPHRIYVESDPGALQIKVSLGHESTIATLDRHTCCFSFGENMGAPDCPLPIERYKWLPTRQPIATDLWNANHNGDRGTAFNTISTWTNRGNDIEWRGEQYLWSKHLEFPKFIDLPKRRPDTAFELAAGVDEDIRRTLKDNCWRIADPVAVSRDVEHYRTYIERSRGEFTVAKDQYIRLRAGWFSDRSACYLAAGRPVINQDTAFDKILPTGKGLFSFRNMEHVLAAVDEIESDYAGNCAAAREIAHEYFCAEKVVGSLMRRAGL